MKNFRSFATSLLAATVVTLAPAQSSDDITALRTKAEKGNGLAQYNLGLAYAEGRGVAADKVEAFVWLSLARENGARGRALDSLVAGLDKASLENAQRRLAEQKAISSGKMPVVSTAKNEPEVVTTIKTSGNDAAPVVSTAPAGDAAQQIATLTADKKQLSDEVAKAWKEIDTLNTALAKAEKEARATNAQTGSATELENAAKFSRELEASLNRANDQKAVAEKNLAATQTELAQVRADLATQTQRVEKLSAAESSRLTPSAEIAAVRQQLTDAQAKITSLTGDLTTVRASETNLHDAVAQLEDEKAKLAAAKPAYPDLSGKVGELEAQLVHANQNAESASASATAAGKQSASDLAASAAEIVRLQSALTAAKSNAPAYPDLSGKVHDLERQLSLANQSAEAATAANKRSAADLAASTAETERLQNALAAAKASSPAYPDLSGKVRELEAGATESAEKLAAAISAQSALQHKLEEANAAAQSSASSAKETSQLQRERDELSGRVASLSSELVRLRTDQEGMQKVLADAKKQASDLTLDAKRAKALESQNASLQTSLGNANARIATLQTAATRKPEAPAYPDLSGKVSDLEAKLAAANQQAESAVQTATNASKQSAADLTAATTKIDQLEKELAAKNSATASSTEGLTGRVHELETQLSNAEAESGRAKQEIASLTRARDEALKNRGPAYPNLAGRVVELQNALADTKHDLTETQAALRVAEQARAAAPVAAAPAPAAESAVATNNGETEELQKKLADAESKLSTALRGYALLQRERDTDAENAAKASEAITNERNTLSSQVATLTSEVEQLKAASSNQASVAQAETTRANESLSALQRSTSQNSSELTAARALIAQLQGTNTVLANENYQLKSKLTPGGVTPVAVPTAPTTPAAAAAAAAAQSKSGTGTVAATTAPRTHVVAAGDTLFRISQRYYGNANRWQEIYKANAAKLGANGVLRVGMELTIP